MQAKSSDTRRSKIVKCGHLLTGLRMIGLSAPSFDVEKFQAKDLRTNF